MSNSRIFTVSEINASIRGLIEVQFPFVSIAGEISNLRQPLSGHCYFTLKDEHSQIRAVLFKMQQRYLVTDPADGQMVICRGRISVYEPRGEYQLIVDTVDFHGTGIMQLEFEKLKRQLAAQGLFDKERKKPLPFFPGHITVVTSPKGAAVHDFIKVARARCPQTKIAVYPVSVQGKAAGGELVEALATINSLLDTDIIVLCRGGGSLEDLWAFNEEKVVRAIAGSAVPVVSAVGHEIDFTIADFAADLRAPTPSAAAEMILPETAALRARILQLQARQAKSVTSLLGWFHDRVAMHKQRLTTLRYPLDHLSLRLDHAAARFHRSLGTLLQGKQHELDQAAQRIRRFDPASRLQLQHQKLVDLRRRLLRSARATVENRQDSLARAAGLLDAVSPLSTLARGYAIARTSQPDEKVITDVTQIEVGDRIEVILHRGTLGCRIEKTSENRLGEEFQLQGGGKKSIE
ncbi:MAG: exodeoxyribonuclease VII large subunit [Desulfobulbaceae bacterium]|nr:exodeoxyribonuclease VII large subunit [Desulfobulbaceae bacterium]